MGKGTMSEWIRLIKNLLIIGAIGVIAYGIYWLFFSSGEDTTLTIDDTPIQIESIRSIAEISTVSYRDEVVVDTVELYKGAQSDFIESINQYYNKNIKRRLTLIVGGEVRYGLDLKKDTFSVRSSNDSIWINLPQPRMLDVNLRPSEMEVFAEIGEWSDASRTKLLSKAKAILIVRSQKQLVQDKCKKNTETTLKKLFPKEKTVIVNFN